MARNRTIPFGYMMQNGEITANPKEVLAVITIFSEYLKGKSLLDIAKQMEVPYSDSAVWNKHMVKRILENEKYLGTDKYPQLVDEKTFRAANEKKLCKAKSLCMISEDLQEIRKLTVCKECGHRLSRMGGCSRSEKWDCRNEGCYRFEYRMTDQMLIGAVLNVLNASIANPSLLESGGEVSSYKPNSEIIRQQNEIHRMMDALPRVRMLSSGMGMPILEANRLSTQIDYDRTKAEILRLAEMKYACCTYSDAPQKTETLKSLLAEQSQLNTLDIGLLKSCVSQILVSHFCTVEVKFINGTVIQNITERSILHDHSIEC